MRKLIYPLVLAALAVALVSTATATTSKTAKVKITNVAFVPKSVSVNVGDYVRWTNTGTVDQRVVCAKCPFTSPVLKPGKAYFYQFNTAGKFAITDPLHTKIKGSVTVTATSKTVTLSASPGTVTYNHNTVLSGAITPARSGVNISILAKECGQSNFSKVATTTTTTGGQYTVNQMPTMNTDYVARWAPVDSPAVTVNVRPVIRLKKIASHKFSVRVKAAKPFAGNYVRFQKKTSHGWVTVKKVTLKTVSTVGSTTVTKAKFKSKIRHHKKVRTLMPSSQAAPCYVKGHSNVIRS